MSSVSSRGAIPPSGLPEAPAKGAWVESSSDIQPGFLEVEVAANAIDHVAADLTRASELRDRVALGGEEMTSEPLVGLRLFLDRTVGAVVEARREAVDAEPVRAAQALGSV